MIAALFVVGALTFVPAVHRVPGRVHTSRRAVQPILIAKTPEEKEVLATSQKVTKIASRFGKAQGLAAQEWVQRAVKDGNADSDELMRMQLTLFEECSVDDESGRCKALSDAIEAMKIAVDKREADKVHASEADCRS